MALFQIIVTVPATTEYLNESDTIFNQLSCHQALTAEGCRMGLVQTIHGFGGGCFSIKTHDAGNFGLHAKGQLIIQHPAFEEFVVRVLFGMLLIKPMQGIETASDMISILVAWWLQIQNWGPIWPEQGASVGGG